MTLREHLAALAKATDLRIGGTPASFQNMEPMQRFRSDLASDPELRTRALTMLASMDERVALRDHITRWQKAALEAALMETTDE